MVSSDYIHSVLYYIEHHGVYCARWVELLTTVLLMEVTFQVFKAEMFKCIEDKDGDLELVLTFHLANQGQD